MGLFFKKTRPDDDLLTRGIRGKGTVQHVHHSLVGMEMSGISGRKAQEMLEGDTTPVRKKVTFLVELPGKAPYTVTTKIPVPVMQSGWLMSGTVFEVIVDPDKPDRLAVDWNAPRQRGTLSQMMADNPMAAAAMRGAGVDPAQLDAQMQAAQQMAASWAAQNPQMAQQIAALQQGLAMERGMLGTAGMQPGLPGSTPSQWTTATPAPGAQPPGSTPAIQAPAWLPGTPGVPGTPEAATPGATTAPAGGSLWPQSEPIDPDQEPKTPEP
ncbi:MAG TPA: hypothetical protein VGB19_06405 [Actinomycetota bacterium]